MLGEALEEIPFVNSYDEGKEKGEEGDEKGEETLLFVRMILSIKRAGSAEEGKKVVENVLFFRSRGVVGVDFCGGKQLFDTAHFNFEHDLSLTSLS